MKNSAAIINDNFYQHTWKLTSQIQGMLVSFTDHLSMADCGLSCDTFNIIYINKGDALPAEEVSKAKTHFEEKGLAYTLWIEDSQLISPTRQLLDELGFRPTNREPGMLLNLDTYQVSAHELFHHIHKSASLEEVRHFAEIVSENWQPPDKNVLDYYMQGARQILAPFSPYSVFVYYEKDKPLAAIEIFASDSSTLGIFSLSTLEAHRGRGIGTALMKFVLNHAKEAGFRQAVLQASQDGIGIYQRLGFSVETHFSEWH